MPRGKRTVADEPSTLTLRSPEDLAALGQFLRARRRRAGLRVAKDAAPFLGVGVRLLVQLESGTRGKRGVTIGKLLDLLQGLGLEMVIQPRLIAGHNACSGAPSVRGTATVIARASAATPQHANKSRTRPASVP